MDWRQRINKFSCFLRKFVVYFSHTIGKKTFTSFKQVYEKLHVGLYAVWCVVRHE